MSHPGNDIVRRLLENDPETLGRVYRWISAVLASPRFWSLRPSWPDLLQETMTRVIASLRTGRFDPTRELRSYVQGVARYTALQALAREIQARSAAVDPASLGSGPGVEEQVARLQVVRRVLDLASEECRRLFHAYFFEERSYNEIAEEQAVPVGTVKSRLFRCLETAHRSVFRSLRKPAPAP